jgi:hypothetical protein
VPKLHEVQREARGDKLTIRNEAVQILFQKFREPFARPNRGKTMKNLSQDTVVTVFVCPASVGKEADCKERHTACLLLSNAATTKQQSYLSLMPNAGTTKQQSYLSLLPNAATIK